MPTDPIFTIPLLIIAIGAVILFWRRTVTLQETLNDTIAFNARAVEALQAQVNDIPRLLTEAKKKAVEDYIAKLPIAEDRIEDVTRDSLIAAMRTMTDQSKVVLNSTGKIAQTFEVDAAHGNPFWPENPPE